MDNSNSPPAPPTAQTYINWGDIPLSPLEQLLADTRTLNKVVEVALGSGFLKDHPFNLQADASTGTDVNTGTDSGPAYTRASTAYAPPPGTLPGAVPVPLPVQETAPATHAATGTVPANPVVTPPAKRGRGRPRTFESKYPPGDPRRRAESVARSRAKRRAGGEIVFDITQVGLMVKQGAGDHIIGSPLADLWFRIVATNGEMQRHINAARHEQDILDQLIAEYEAQYPLGKVRE